MKRLRLAATLLALQPLTLAVAPAPAQTAPSAGEAAVRATIARWYEELLKEDKGRPYALTAPGFIDATPWYEHINNGSAALGPRIYTSLAARALKFAYAVRSIRLDSNFAKVRVIERGYFYARAAQKTYETMASTLFILERQEHDGRWLILAHESSSVGFPPDEATNPMPDLRDLFYATEGKGRDPARDAEEARKF